MIASCCTDDMRCGIDANAAGMGCISLEEVRAFTSMNASDGGTGVGLKNVCERLIARYGVQAGCFHGPDPEGGFTVHVIMPVIRNG